MDPDSALVQKLLQSARRGDAEALTQLFARYQERLRRTVELHLDRRVAARVGASDVLQEAFLEAARRWPEYLKRQEMPFPLWLQWLAREKVLEAHRRHIRADKRAVSREVPPLPADSSAEFVRSLAGCEPTTSQNVVAAELAERLRLAIQRLDDDERELILWRHFEQLSIRDTAQLLGISEAAASKRYVRALERLRGFLLSLGVSSVG